jgi:hypothetical protein
MLAAIGFLAPHPAGATPATANAQHKMTNLTDTAAEFIFT